MVYRAGQKEPYMLRYIARRLFQLPIMILLVLTFVFASMHLSGDPATLFLTQDSGPEDVIRVRERLGLNDPLPVQYGRFVANGIRGDLGNSLRYNQPAIELLLKRLPATLELAGASIVLSLFRYSGRHYFCAAQRFLARPVIDDRRFVRAGRSGVLDRHHAHRHFLRAVRVASGVGGWLLAAFGPAICNAGGLLRGADRAVYPHILPRRLAAEFYPHRIGQGTAEVFSAVASRGTERRYPGGHNHRLDDPVAHRRRDSDRSGFSWPGIGGFIVTAVYNRDFPIVQAGTFIIALFVGLLNIAIDLIYAALDPRIQLK